MGQNEKESWGELTEEQFEELTNKFTEQFGKPRLSRRLAMSFWDHTRNNVDTRIRITDGQAEIMQKVGSWEMSKEWSRSETSVSLINNVEQVCNAYRVMRTLIPGNESCYIAQFENRVFLNEDYEIKLTHQFGQEDKYNFEVEAVSEGANMGQILEKSGLAGMVKLTDEEFWDKWNREVNLNASELTESELRQLVSRYMEADG